MLSKTEEYALRAAVHLARQPSESLLRATDMAKATGIPSNYLSKVLHRLGQRGVVVSERGRRGGFQLAAEPQEIRLDEVLEPFRPHADRTRCLLGRPECSDANPCGAHFRWKGIKEQMARFFAETTLADVIRDGGDDRP